MFRYSGTWKFHIANCSVGSGWSYTTTLWYALGSSTDQITRFSFFLFCALAPKNQILMPQEQKPILVSQYVHFCICAPPKTVEAATQRGLGWFSRNRRDHRQRQVLRCSHFTPGQTKKNNSCVSYCVLLLFLYPGI